MTGRERNSSKKALGLLAIPSFCKRWKDIKKEKFPSGSGREAQEAVY